MPPIQFACPSCGQLLQTGAVQPGAVIACPACKTHLRVPALPPGSPSSSAASVGPPRSGTATPPALPPSRQGKDSTGVVPSPSEEVIDLPLEPVEPSNQVKRPGQRGNAPQTREVQALREEQEQGEWAEFDKEEPASCSPLPFGLRSGFENLGPTFRSVYLGYTSIAGWMLVLPVFILIFFIPVLLLLAEALLYGYNKGSITFLFCCDFPVLVVLVCIALLLSWMRYFGALAPITFWFCPRGMVWKQRGRVEWCFWHEVGDFKATRLTIVKVSTALLIPIVTGAKVRHLFEFTTRENPIRLNGEKMGRLVEPCGNFIRRRMTEERIPRAWRSLLDGRAPSLRTIRTQLRGSRLRPHLPPLGGVGRPTSRVQRGGSRRSRQTGCCQRRPRQGSGSGHFRWPVSSQPGTRRFPKRASPSASKSVKGAISCRAASVTGGSPRS